MRLTDIRRLSFLILFAATPAFAADPLPVPCPNDKPCHVITLDETEMKLLTMPNGILQTAGQARAIDLGQYVVYFQQKLQNAPSGEVKPQASPPAAQGNPALGAGPTNPANVATPEKK